MRRRLLRTRDVNTSLPAEVNAIDILFEGLLLRQLEFETLSEMIEMSKTPCRPADGGH